MATEVVSGTISLLGETFGDFDSNSWYTVKSGTLDYVVKRYGNTVKVLFTKWTCSGITNDSSSDASVNIRVKLPGQSGSTIASKNVAANTTIGSFQVEPGVTKSINVTTEQVSIVLVVNYSAGMYGSTTFSRTISIPSYSPSLYGSVNGQTKAIQKLYGSVNGQAKEIVKLYGSVNGVAKRIY